MGQGPTQDPKWQGRVTAHIHGPTADQAWLLLKDFCSVHRWVPSIDTCRKIHGSEGEPGCIRYCSGPVNRSDNNHTIGWSVERLTDFDPLTLSYSYEVLETNKGFGSYSATIRLVPDPGSESGCVLEWIFDADPITGWTREGFVEFLGRLAEVAARRVEEEVIKAGK